MYERETISDKLCVSMWQVNGLWDKSANKVYYVQLFFISLSNIQLIKTITITRNPYIYKCLKRANYTHVRLPVQVKCSHSL